MFNSVVEDDPLDSLAKLLLVLSEDTDTPKPQPTKAELRRKRIPGYVYLARAGRYCKIGCSQKPDVRMKAGKAWLREVKLLHVIESNDMYRLEAEFHKRFDPENINNELFKLSAKQVKFVKSIRGPVLYRIGDKSSSLPAGKE